MRMLLVEDHDELSLWLQKALAASGFAVDIAVMVILRISYYRLKIIR